MWWPLLDALRDHLTGYLVPELPALPLCAIIMGGDGSIPTEPTIILKRGPAKTASWTESWSGVNWFYLEVWNHNDNVETAYSGLATLESTIISALSHPIQLAGYELLTRIIAVDPDGDAFRPSAGSQMTIEIEWQKTL